LAPCCSRRVQASPRILKPIRFLADMSLTGEVMLAARLRIAERQNAKDSIGFAG